MIPSPEKILDWAQAVMPEDPSDWLRAMRAEMAVIPAKPAQYSFALGGLKAALYHAAQSRKALHYIARLCGAACLFMICGYGLYNAAKFGNSPKEMVTGQLITGLCLLYMCGAGLLILSLKGLKIFAAAGLSIGLFSALYLKAGPSHHGLLPHEFLMALSLEASALMIVLLGAAVYLELLYKDGHDTA